jgi:hypothetical protein
LQSISASIEGISAKRLRGKPASRLFEIALVLVRLDPLAFFRESGKMPEYVKQTVSFLGSGDLLRLADFLIVWMRHWKKNAPSFSRHDAI